MYGAKRNILKARTLLKTFGNRPQVSANVENLAHMLRALTAGEADALARIMPLVYAQLREIASRQLRSLGASATLSTTVLVHEAYERLAGRQNLALDDERHFYALCGRVMRQIVIDYARERDASKRGGGAFTLALTDMLPKGGQDNESADASAHDGELAVRLAQALSQFTELDPELAELAEMAWFAGLDNAQIARLSGRHLRQVQRDLQRARAWLAMALSP